MERADIGMRGHVYCAGIGWGYMIEGIRSGSRLYPTKARAAAAARRAVKRKVRQVFDAEGQGRVLIGEIVA